MDINKLLSIWMFSSINKGYEMLWKSFIRPERENYSIYDLGDRIFTLVDDRTYQRTDFSIVSSNGCRIQCSHFEPLEASRPEEIMPCVIYLHGNCGSRIEGLDTVPMLLPYNMTVVCFDWAGCGLSEGEYVTLGWYERYDLEILANYLIKNRRVSSIGLWGRSMGAVAAIYYASQNFPIAGLVLDSPFSSLRKLATEIGEKAAGVPNFLINRSISLYNFLEWSLVAQRRETLFFFVLSLLSNSCRALQSNLLLLVPVKPSDNQEVQKILVAPCFIRLSQAYVRSKCLPFTPTVKRGKTRCTRWAKYKIPLHFFLL